MAKNKVKVNVASKPYTIIGDDSTEHMISVGQLVDTNVRDIADNYPNLSVSDRAVLAAINVADEYIKTREKLTSMVEELTLSEQLLIERLEDLTQELGELKASVEAAERQVPQAHEDEIAVDEPEMASEAEVFDSDDLDDPAKTIVDDAVLETSSDEISWDDDDLNILGSEDTNQPEVTEDPFLDTPIVVDEEEVFEDKPAQEEAEQAEDAEDADVMWKPMGYVMEEETAPELPDVQDEETKESSEEEETLEETHESDVMAFLMDEKPEDETILEESIDAEKPQVDALESDAVLETELGQQDAQDDIASAPDAQTDAEPVEADTYNADKELDDWNTPDSGAEEATFSNEVAFDETSASEEEALVDDEQGEDAEEATDAYVFGGQTSFDLGGDADDGEDEEDYPDTSMLDKPDYRHNDKED